MDAHDDDIPEFAAPLPKPKAPPKPKPEAPKAKPDYITVEALRRTHIDPADIKGYRGAEQVSIRLEPKQRLDNLKADKAESLIAKGILRAV